MITIQGNEKIGKRYWCFVTKLVMFCTVWLFVSLDIVSQCNKISYLHDLRPFYVTNPTNQLTHNRHYMFKHCFDSLSYYSNTLSCHSFLINLKFLNWFLAPLWTSRAQCIYFGGNIKGKWKKSSAIKMRSATCNPGCELLQSKV